MFLFLHKDPEKLYALQSQDVCFIVWLLEKVEFLVSYPFKCIINYDNSNQRVSHLSPRLPDEEL